MAKPLSKFGVVPLQGMQLSRLPRTRTRRAPRAPRPRPQEPPRRETNDARRAGGPEDRALYACACGFVFTEAVTTSVGCPHCGTEQAW
jgi:hypothetical protein